MTREFKIGMTGKTTKGFFWVAFEDDGSDKFPICIRIIWDEEGSDYCWLERDGDGWALSHLYGDLIHPDDAKEIRVTEGEAITGPSDERVAEIKAALRGVSAVDLAPIPGRIDPLRAQLVCAALTGLLSAGTYGAEKDVAMEAVLYADAALALLSEKEG